MAEKKIMVVDYENINVTIDVDGETIDKVNSFKCIAVIKTNTDSWSEDFRARMGMTRNSAIALDTIWKYRGIRKYPNMKLVKELMWPVITCIRRSRLDFKERRRNNIKSS